MLSPENKTSKVTHKLLQKKVEGGYKQKKKNDSHFMSQIDKIMSLEKEKKKHWG